MFSSFSNGQADDKKWLPGLTCSAKPADDEAQQVIHRIGNAVPVKFFVLDPCRF
jgi:hypothetical protein